jgi:hypothetical protein
MQLGTFSDDTSMVQFFPLIKGLQFRSQHWNALLMTNKGSQGILWE